MQLLQEALCQGVTCNMLFLQDFLEAYKGVDFTKSPEKYFKYSVTDIQTMLIDTFAR